MELDRLTLLPASKATPTRRIREPDEPVRLGGARVDSRKWRLERRFGGAVRPYAMEGAFMGRAFLESLSDTIAIGYVATDRERHIDLGVGRDTYNAGPVYIQKRHLGMH